MYHLNQCAKSIIIVELWQTTLGTGKNFALRQVRQTREIEMVCCWKLFGLSKETLMIFTSICIDQSFTIINILVSWSVGWYCLFVCLMVLLDWAGLGAYQLLSSNLIVNAEGNLSNEIMVAVARFVMKSYKLKLSLKNTWRIII